jgi:DNA-binding MarR family transcriptional regulator
MARRRTAKRSRVIDELMLQARRSGSLGGHLNRAVAPLAGIGATDWECLDVLDWSGPITAGELARKVGITSGAVTGSIDRLEALALVRRGADPNDRRKVIVELAHDAQASWAAQHQKMGECFQALSDDVAAINEEFDDGELEVVARWLRLSNEALMRAIEQMREALQSEKRQDS